VQIKKYRLDYHYTWPSPISNETHWQDITKDPHDHIQGGPQHAIESTQQLLGRYNVPNVEIYTEKDSEKYLYCYKGSNSKQ